MNVLLGAVAGAVAGAIGAELAVWRPRRRRYAAMQARIEERIRRENTVGRTSETIRSGGQVVGHVVGPPVKPYTETPEEPKPYTPSRLATPDELAGQTADPVEPEPPFDWSEDPQITELHPGPVDDDGPHDATASIDDLVATLVEAATAAPDVMGVERYRLLTTFRRREVDAWVRANGLLRVQAVSDWDPASGSAQLVRRHPEGRMDVARERVTRPPWLDWDGYAS